jgi:hypothetical protein
LDSILEDIIEEKVTGTTAATVTGSNGEEAIVAKDEDEGETTATTAVRGTSEGTIVTRFDTKLTRRY